MFNKKNTEIKLSILTILFLSLIIFSSCTKKEEKELNYKKEILNGIEIITNENKPSNPDYNYKITKSLEILSEDNEILDSLRYLSSITDVQFDESGNILVLDSKTCSVKKFDNTGKYLKSFGAKGQGPGELETVSSMIILNKFIYLSNANGRVISKFDEMGNFIEKIKTEGNFPPKLTAFGNNKSIGSGTMAFITQVDGEINMKIKFFLTVLDSNFNRINDIVDKKISCKMDEAGKFLSNNVILTTTDKKEKIFLAKNSDSEYEISIYDIAGDIKSKIRKKYIKRRKQIEKEKIEDENENNKLQKQVNQALKKGDSKYYNSIDNIFYDGKGRLLVKTPLSEEEKFDGKKYFDLFIDGIFINRIKLDIEENGLLFFRSGKLISINSDDNSFIVYEL